VSVVFFFQGEPPIAFSVCWFLSPLITFPRCWVVFVCCFASSPFAPRPLLNPTFPHCLEQPLSCPPFCRSFWPSGAFPPFAFFFWERFRFFFLVVRESFLPFPHRLTARFSKNFFLTATRACPSVSPQYGFRFSAQIFQFTPRLAPAR